MIDLILGTRQQKEELIAQMGSDVRDVAVPAVDMLRREGWLTDDSLRGADFRSANLEKANLGGAVLVEAHLTGSYARGATLSRSDLQGADLRGARYLDKANFKTAKLKGAKVLTRDVETLNHVGASLEGVEVVDYLSF